MSVLSRYRSATSYQPQMTTQSSIGRGHGRGLGCDFILRRNSSKSRNIATYLGMIACNLPITSRLSDEVTLTGEIQMYAANRTGGDIGRQVIPQETSQAGTRSWRMGSVQHWS